MDKEKEKKKTKMRELSNLTEDLLMEILSRLRVKLLLQCRCVCKPWLALISDNKFIKLHLSRSPTHLLLQSNPFKTVDSSELDKPEPEFQNLPRNFPSGLSVSASCNGLLLISDENRTFTALVNPSTRDHIKLPRYGPPVFERGDYWELDNHRNITLGLGYDSVADVYKVVVIASICDKFYCINLHDKLTNLDEYIKSAKTEVRVFTIGTDSWRRVDVSPLNPCYLIGRFAIHVNGVLYCDNIQLNSPIVTFDLRSEKFGEVARPDLDGSDRKKCCDFVMAAVDGCLCLCGSVGEVLGKYGDKRVDIWLLKESWVRVYSIELAMMGRIGKNGFRFLAIRKNGEMLLHLPLTEQVVLYDPVAKAGRVVCIRGDPEIFWTYTYEEALTSIASLMAGNKGEGR